MERDMDDLHLWEVKEVRHKTHKILIKTKVENMMCEMSGTNDSVIAQSPTIIQR